MSPVKTPETRLSVNERIHNYDEVCQGYTPEQAKAEAERCLNCPDRYCAVHCPAHNYIPEFIAEIRNGDLDAAWELLSRTNPFMQISCRVCPYETQCESECTRGIRSEPVAISRLERFVADWHRANRAASLPKTDKAGKSVAIVGSGPAGLSCAASLVRAGYDITVLEKTDTLGGVPAWGIPSFVLPAEPLQWMIWSLKELGVKFKTGVEVGKDITVQKLQEDYDAVFIATGAGTPVELKAEGRELSGVVQAADYLRNADAFPGKTVAVIGGGNTAIDAARTALRQGASSVKLVYRRTKEDMPATSSELAIALEEGVELVETASPVRFAGKDGTLTAVECDRMELRAPDYPGGRNNTAPSGETFTLEADLAILALGFKNEPLPGITCDGAGKITVDKNRATALKGVYAGGDAVTGAATLIKAVAAGTGVAATIFESFN